MIGYSIAQQRHHPVGKTYFLNCKSLVFTVFLSSVPDFSKAEIRFFNVGKSCFVILLSCFAWPFVVLNFSNFYQISRMTRVV